MAISESTQITTRFIPKLVQEAKVPISNIKTDCGTKYTLNKRADVLISTQENISTEFDDNILTLIEAKSEDVEVLDIYCTTDSDNKNIKDEIRVLIEENLKLYEENSDSI